MDSSSGGDGSSGDTSSGGADEESETTGQAEAGSIIYVHLDGITLTDGPDDPVNETSASLSGTYGAYSGSNRDRAALIEHMQQHWAPFDVAVTDVRPAQGPYVMAVITPPGAFPPGGGVSPLDCNDFNPTSIVFAFEPGTPEEIARVASGRVGVSMGVSNSSEPGDLSGGNANANASWLDACIPLDEPSQCVQQAVEFCGAAGEQNTFQIVLSVLGPAA